MCNCNADEIARSGADAVTCFFLVNEPDAARVADHRAHLAEITRICRQIGYPVIVEALVVDDQGHTVRKTRDILRAARLAAELGVSVLKIDSPLEIADLEVVVGSVNVLVCIRGGTPRDKEVDTLADVDAYMQAGARGIVYGRGIFQAVDPAHILSNIHRVVHGGIA
ncbi:hypothetical protein P9A16_21040 [Shinella sp. 838]|uniref:hypothetical protein n=1 Tax=unclassified Shinella TaxID=2643062 RepID=UPI0009E008B1|nr:MULTISPECIES: hypothetical protein [unclassified Shinella]MCA0338917.1 hypothetical protein [Pseudomonadota bacterium]MDG4673623.1 hypothetical protein [Shinella sp. 838]